MRSRTTAKYNYGAAVVSFADHIQHITGEDRRKVLESAVERFNFELAMLASQGKRESGRERMSRRIKGI